MPAIDDLLDQLTASRIADPLAPATVIVPSRLAGLQLRRRLASKGAFAGVRFEPMARIAELLAAAELARDDRRPLARPIADYVASQVALESRPPLNKVADLQGYAVALRQTFRRLRRAGFVNEAGIPKFADSPHLSEIARLYGIFRERTERFYDEDDLLDLASRRLREDTSHVLPELGAVWVLPAVAMSASAADFLDAVRAVVPSYIDVQLDAAQPDESFVLAPDAASEARAVVRGVIEVLEQGIAIDDIAVFYSGDRAYRGLLANAFAAAEVPIAAMPGTPLVELAAGRAVLALARLPLVDYARAELFDVLNLAAMRPIVPAGDEQVPLRAGQWLRLARSAGVTHGRARWRDNLELLLGDRQRALNNPDAPTQSRHDAYTAEVEAIPNLRNFVATLIERLEPLRRLQPAREFVSAFRALVDAYFAPEAEGFGEIQAEIEQLGTIDAVGGQFNLESFADALEANLRIASKRDRGLGEGVLVTSYRAAGGLSFQRVFLCGAYEGAFPAVAESEPLLQDEVWAQLREQHPYTEDLGLRIVRSRVEVSRLLASAEGGSLTWSSPLLAAGGTREYYPAPDMTKAASRFDTSIASATDLRRHASTTPWLRKSPSPLSSLLTGPALDGWERRIRESIAKKKGGVGIGPGHWLEPARKLLRERGSHRFTPYDGFVSLPNLVAEGAYVSPTSLEHYASCGFRYFLGSVLRLRAIDEPEEGETIGAAERGSLVHKALDRFYKEVCTPDYPAPDYRWAGEDVERLLEIFEEEYRALKQQGRAGLEIFADYDRRLLRTDLESFLESDSDFRAETGAIPTNFELRVGPTQIGNVTVSGFVDRIDRTPDGLHAYVLDYKTGSKRTFENKDPNDPFLGGTKLQLPIYVMAAADAENVQAAYWFISRRGEFSRLSYENTPKNKERFEETIGAIMSGVREGAFPAVPGEDDDFHGGFTNCQYCEFDRVCSRRRVYEAHDKELDIAVLPWSRVVSVAKGEQPEPGS